ncbi:hypothetical protein BC826DRAFT_1062239 [Russula brevipes]|nr:hypothetical protein BC826DRAFT_1062239 [Russula brevipes]
MRQTCSFSIVPSISKLTRVQGRITMYLLCWKSHASTTQTTQIRNYRPWRNSVPRPRLFAPP